jgi:hypothetical protein
MVASQNRADWKVAFDNSAGRRGEITDKGVPKRPEKNADKSADRSADKVANKNVDKSTNRHVDKTSDPLLISESEMDWLEYVAGELIASGMAGEFPAYIPAQNYATAGEVVEMNALLPYSTPGLPAEQGDSWQQLMGRLPESRKEQVAITIQFQGEGLKGTEMQLRQQGGVWQLVATCTSEAAVESLKSQSLVLANRFSLKQLGRIDIHVLQRATARRTQSASDQENGNDNSMDDL